MLRREHIIMTQLRISLVVFKDINQCFGPLCADSEDPPLLTFTFDFSSRNHVLLNLLASFFFCVHVFLFVASREKTRSESL